MKRAMMLIVLGCSALFAQEQSISKNTVALKPPPATQVEKNFEHQILILDGLKCTKCSFKNLTLLYSGGEYNLTNATFSGVIQFEMHGAAANAALLSSGLSSTQPNQRKLITFSTPKTMTLRNIW